MEPTIEQIQELRKVFLDELATKEPNAVHAKDLERFKKDDNWLKRFLMHHELNLKSAIGMIWETFNWRKENKINDINEFAKMEIIVQGGFFPHGKDKDGCTLFIFKSKRHTKGNYNFEDLKKCVIYWFERLEREGNGKPLTLFFDMEGCGLANMDMEFTKYLINLFKYYYPYYLNYILIFEMPWVLSAAFKIIKSWLPEKAVQKIKFISKKDVQDYVPRDQALTCWGGDNDYTFSFLPEVEEICQDIMTTPNINNKKVHFADGSPMSESPINSGEKESDGGILKVTPPNILNFTKDGNELSAIVDLQNTDSEIIISYKLKTTSPEKFRVRPSVGYLLPDTKVKVNVTLLTGFQLSGSSKDKFLVMSTPIDSSETSQDLAELWKNTSGRKINQHRLRCMQTTEIIKNGNVLSVNEVHDSDQSNFNQLTNNIQKLSEHQSQLHRSLKMLQYLQFGTLIVIILVGIILIYLIKDQNLNNNSYCMNPNQ